MNNGGPADEAALRLGWRALERLPLVAEPYAGPGASMALRSQSARPVTAALGRIAAGYAQAVAAGAWQRLRRCPAEDCAWAFWDSSTKGTRRWCTMSVCGNREKARKYAQRRRNTATRSRT